jgi:hypothetical protein
LSIEDRLRSGREAALRLAGRIVFGYKGDLGSPDGFAAGAGHFFAAEDGSASAASSIRRALFPWPAS